MSIKDLKQPIIYSVSADGEENELVYGEIRGKFYTGPFGTRNHDDNICTIIITTRQGDSIHLSDKIAVEGLISGLREILRINDFLKTMEELPQILE
jgi:hypothetical protein